MKPRYVFVDGLRGLAAVAVMLYHLGTGDLERPLARVLSQTATALFARGWLGVHVFFVLSGFVIAHSVGRHPMSLRSAMRFVLRRQVRLDPPYWCAIVVGTAIPLVARFARPHVPRFVPGPRDILAHVFYVYDLLHMPAISWVFWSLAIEVQFYLVFVLALALFRRVPPALPWLVAASALFSLHGAVTWRFPHEWFVTHWYLFALGALTRWALDRRVTAWLPVSLSALLLAVGARFGRPEPIAGGAVALLIYFAGVRGALGRWLGARPLQFLGATSYGIYLFHTPFAGPVQLALGRVIDATVASGALVIMASQITVTLIAAALLHRTVESWAIRLAGRIRWERDEGPLLDGVGPRSAGA